MGRSFDTYDGISAAEVGIYSIFLFGSIYLCIKHGFAKSAGWRALLVLSLLRLVGGGMRLATVSMDQDLHNTTLINLYIGWSVCNSLGLGPLVLMLLGLLSRAFESMNRNGHPIIKPMYHRLIQILMLVGMILLITGATQTNYPLDGSTKIDYPQITRIGLALMLIVVGLLCLEAAVAVMNRRYVASGEHRLILVIVLSLPFVIARAAYSAVRIYGHVRSSAYLSLGMSVIMEIIVVTMCQILGFLLDKAPQEPKPVDAEIYGMQRLSDRLYEQQQPPAQYLPPGMYQQQPPQTPPEQYGRRQMRQGRRRARRY